MDLKYCIGLHVKTARCGKKLSQQQLAEKIDRSTETVSNIERAVTIPNIETIERLSKVLNIPLMEFFEGYDNTTNDRKRLRTELEIREYLKKLSTTELEMTRVQIEALVNMNQT